MRRNGAWLSISRKAASSLSSMGLAKPRSNSAPAAIVSRDGSTSATLPNKSAVNPVRSLRVMEDDADGVAVATSQPADTMPHVDAVGSARPLHGTMVHGKGHRIALPQRYDFGARLHARALLGQHEFATSEIATGFGQQDRH